MAFSDEDPPRRRQRGRSGSSKGPAPWPRKDEPLSWAMLPPEEAEEDEGAEAEEEIPLVPGALGRPEAPPAAKEAEEDWKSRYQYLMADFENFRRRVAKESEGAVAAARGKVLLKVVGLHEGIERAREALPPDAKTLKDGLTMVLKNMDAFLEEEGLSPVAKAGDRFLPEVHEAVGQVPAGAGTPEGTVVQVVQQGYRGPGGLLRPAKVMVAGGGKAGSAGPSRGAGPSAS